MFSMEERDMSLATNKVILCFFPQELKSLYELRSALALLLIRLDGGYVMFSFPRQSDSKAIGLESTPND